MHVDDERKAFVRRDSTGREFVSLTVDGEHSFRKDLNGLFDLFYKDGLTDVKISGTLRAHLSKGGSGAIFEEGEMEDYCVDLNRDQLALSVEGHASDVDHVDLWLCVTFFVLLIGDCKLTELLHQLVSARLH